MTVKILSNIGIYEIFENFLVFKFYNIRCQAYITKRFTPSEMLYMYLISHLREFILFKYYLNTANFEMRSTRRRWKSEGYPRITESKSLTFYKTAWKKRKKSSSSIPNRLNHNGTTVTNDMCQHWREYYSDLAEEEYHPDKFNK